MSMVACTSLFDSPNATTDEINRCESEALNAVKKSEDSLKSGASEETMWNCYRQLMMEIFLEISEVAPSSEPNSTSVGMKDSSKSEPPFKGYASHITTHRGKVPPTVLLKQLIEIGSLQPYC